MAQTMKIRQGDIVHVIRGKDRGKEGRVIASMPKDGRVLVENVNMVKRHQRPRPIQNANRMGGPSIVPGGIIEKSAPLPVSMASGRAIHPTGSTRWSGPSASSWCSRCRMPASSSCTAAPPPYAPLLPGLDPGEGPGPYVPGG